MGLLKIRGGTSLPKPNLSPPRGTQGNYATVGSAIVAIAIVGRGG